MNIISDSAADVELSSGLGDLANVLGALEQKLTRTRTFAWCCSKGEHIVSMKTLGVETGGFRSNVKTFTWLCCDVHVREIEKWTHDLFVPTVGRVEYLNCEFWGGKVC